MGSGVLAGLLKLVAVGAAAGGLATGVYFLAQADGDDDPLSQTTQTAVQVSTSTPSAHPAGPTPPAIDTSDWLTYESPLGFTIKYPPTWVVQEFPGDPSGLVKILNERRQETIGQLPPSGEGAQSGDAWVEISLGGLPRFDVEGLFRICGVDDASIRQSGLSVQATRTTFAGLPAVHCVQEGPNTFDPQQQITVQVYWVGLPSDAVVGIRAYAVDQDATVAQTIQTVLSSASFTGNIP